MCRKVDSTAYHTTCRLQLIAQQTDAHEFLQNFDVGLAKQDSCGVRKGGRINYVVSIVPVLPSRRTFRVIVFQFRHSLLLNLSIASRLFVWHYFFPPPSSFKSNVPSKKITLNVMLKMAAVQHLCATLSNFNLSDVTSSSAARVQSLRTEKDTFAYVTESTPEDNSSREGARPSCS